MRERLQYFSDKEPHYVSLLLIQGHTIFWEHRDAFMVFNAYCSKLALLNHIALLDGTPESPGCVDVVYTPLFDLKNALHHSMKQENACR